MSTLLDNMHRLTQIADARLEVDLATFAAHFDVTPRQIRVLRAIDSHPDGSQTALVAVTGIDRSTLADIMRRLIKKGLATRQRQESDARAYAVTLTSDGVRVLAEARRCEARVERELVRDMPELDAVRALDLSAMPRDPARKGPALAKRQTYRAPARAAATANGVR